MFQSDDKQMLRRSGIVHTKCESVHQIAVSDPMEVEEFRCVVGIAKGFEAIVLLR